MGKRNTLITGGSGGIGQALVRCFVAAGDRVWFTFHRGRDRAESLVDELPNAELTALHLDQGDLDSHARLMEDLPDCLHVVIHNAGLGSKTVEREAADWRRQDEAMLRVNVLGPLWLTQDVLPRMPVDAYGKIIFVSSVGGGIALFPRFRLADSVSKAGLAHLGRELAARMSHRPIDVFTICPGATDTPMFWSSTLDRLDESERAELLRRLPDRRMISAEEVAELCVYLCEDRARLLRGAVIDSSLGLGVRPSALDDGSVDAKVPAADRAGP